MITLYGMMSRARANVRTPCFAPALMCSAQDAAKMNMEKILGFKNCSKLNLIFWVWILLTQITRIYWSWDPVRGTTTSRWPKVTSQRCTSTLWCFWSLSYKNLYIKVHYYLNTDVRISCDNWYQWCSSTGVVVVWEAMPPIDNGESARHPEYGWTQFGAMNNLAKVKRLCQF